MSAGIYTDRFPRGPQPTRLTITLSSTEAKLLLASKARTKVTVEIKIIKGQKKVV